MYYKNSVLILISLALYISCGLKQSPFKEDKENKVGSVFVTSDITGARIFVNSDTTGKVTPDTIKNVPLGKALIEIFKDGYLVNPDSVIVNVTSDSVVSAEFFLEYITNQGKLFFNSTPNGAKIIVDSSNSGKFTPDTIVVAAGSHQFDLYKNGFDSLEIGHLDVVSNSLLEFDEVLSLQNKVLIESFANSSCLPCTTTNEHLENFTASNSAKQYALIEYFTSWPNPQDPMYLHNTAGSYARFGPNFYALTSVPSMFINGNSVDATDYSSIQNTFNNQISGASSDISISLSKNISDSLRVTVELNELNALPAGSWRLFIAVIEKQVSFAQPPGSNELSDFMHVFRKFVTANEGDSFSFTNSVFRKTYSTSISSEWDLNDIQIIGFVQDINTKEVLNSSHL